MTPYGQRAITASDYNLHVWDIESGVCLRTLEGHSYAFESINVTCDGRRAISANRHDTLNVWDIESGIYVRTLVENHSESVNSVSVTPDGLQAV